MAYASIKDVETRMQRTFDESETKACEVLLDDAAVIIDSYNKDATAEAKLIVSCNIIKRIINDSVDDIPMGASQGSISALGYSQSWTMSGGSVGEMYLAKLDKKLLGVGNHIGCSNPFGEA